MMICRYYFILSVSHYELFLYGLHFHPSDIQYHVKVKFFFDFEINYNSGFGLNLLKWSRIPENFLN